MIEAVPFLHVIAFSIQDRLGGMENAHAVVATTMVAYALTGILTGACSALCFLGRLGDVDFRFIVIHQAWSSSCLAIFD